MQLRENKTTTNLIEILREIFMFGGTIIQDFLQVLIFSILFAVPLTTHAPHIFSGQPRDPTDALK